MHGRPCVKGTLRIRLNLVNKLAHSLRPSRLLRFPARWCTLLHRGQLKCPRELGRVLCTRFNPRSLSGFSVFVLLLFSFKDFFVTQWDTTGTVYNLSKKKRSRQKNWGYSLWKAAYVRGKEVVTLLWNKWRDYSVFKTFHVYASRTKHWAVTKKKSYNKKYTRKLFFHILHRQ